MRLFNLLTLIFIVTVSLPVDAAITLTQAWHQVESNHPSVDAARANIGAAQGQVIQAGLLPNPTFTTLQGSVPGFGKYSNNPNADSNYLINQLIETGGKRRARREVAEAEYQATTTALQVNSTELFGQTVQAFLAVAEAEAKLRFSQRGVSLNQQTIGTINQRMNAGRASPLDLQTARIALSDQRLTVLSNESELNSARFALSRLWNGSEKEVQKILVPPLKEMPLYPLAFYLQKAENNWEIKALSQAEKIAKAQIKLAESKKYPDVTVGMGLSHFYQNSDPKSHNAVIAEFAVPIPLFDRNQGNAVTASENYRRSLDDSRNKVLLLQSSIMKAYQIASQARIQLKILKTTILPESFQTLKLAKQGYEQGKFSYLDMLTAQQKLLDAQMHEVTTLFLYYRAWYVLQISTGMLPRKDNA